MTSTSVTQTADAERISTAAGGPLGVDLPQVEDAGGIDPRDARALNKLFLDRLSVLEEGTHEYQYVRNTLIEMNLSLVRYVAGRFAAAPTRWRTSSRWARSA
ncbi:hypothetical protein [Streptomyces sp. TYQ1024]|uniref:hypothetical protein n=1 Tax=Streptomyces sp. TYQ1024 TaxID=2762559 RepID=UPI00403ED38E